MLLSACPVSWEAVFCKFGCSSISSYPGLQARINTTALMSTHNICFGGEMGKILFLNLKNISFSRVMALTSTFYIDALT